MDPRHDLDRLDLLLTGEPPVPPLTATLAAGRRALLRRRVATGAGALAVVAVLVGGWSLVPGPTGGGAAPAERGTEQTPSATPEPTPHAEPQVPRWRGRREAARYVDGELVLRPGIEVHQRIEDPLEVEPAGHSVGLDFTVREVRGWFFLVEEVGPDGRMGPVSTWSEPSRGWDDFEDWLADQVASHRLPISATPPGPPETLLTFQQDRLVGVPGTIEVLEQVSRPPMPRNFAPPGARTAAAVVEEGGERSFVLVREIDGQLQEIDGGPVGGRTLDQFVTESRAAYESGEGLL